MTDEVLAKPAEIPTEEAETLCDLSQSKFLIIGYKAPAQDARWEYTFRDPLIEYWNIWDYLVLHHHELIDGRTMLMAKIGKAQPRKKRLV